LIDIGIAIFNHQTQFSLRTMKTLYWTNSGNIIDHVSRHSGILPIRAKPVTNEVKRWINFRRDLFAIQTILPERCGLQRLIDK